MDPKDLFAKAVQQATSCVQHIRLEHLSLPTPCSEWDLKALLNHMVYELIWVPDMMRGKTVAEVGNRFDGDLLHTDPKSAWQHTADAALVSVHQVGPDVTVHLSYADKPAKDYIQEVGTDIFIHAWDVAQAMNATLLFDETMAQIIHEYLLPRQAEFVASGSYAPALEVDNDASLQDKLLALTGRSATKWRSA